MLALASVERETGLVEVGIWGGFDPLDTGVTFWFEPILQLAVVAVFVVPVSWVSDGGLVHTCCAWVMPDDATVAVLVVPVS